MFKNLLIASALMTSVSAFAKVETHAVDTATSKITYLGTKVTGKHTGEIKVQEGSVDFDGKNFKAATVTADMTSITNTDLTDAEYNKKFIDHMKSDDFFSIENHKTAVLKTTKVTKVKGDTYKVTADLTIKGKTAPVTFDATVTKTNANAVVNVDRTKYDIKYGSGKFFQGLGDKMINDEFQLTVNLTLK